MNAPISDALLLLLAEDALVVLRWSMKTGLKRPQQIEETVKAFKKRLADSQSEPDVADPATADARLDLARAL